MLQDVLSFQLYSARNFPPLAHQLATLRRLGYTNVEPFGGLYDDVEGLAVALEAAKLTAKSGHIALTMLETEPDRAIAIAKRLGMTYVVVPYLTPDQRPSDRAGWMDIGRRLSAVAEQLGPHGFRLAYHNHDFEFRPLADGSYPIEHVLGGSCLWEADLAWVAKAGADPKPWLERYAGRVPLVHVKDIAASGQNAEQDGWADVGEGTLGWAELWGAAVKAGALLMIAEHDNPSDVERFARVSAAAMSSYQAKEHA